MDPWYLLLLLLAAAGVTILLMVLGRRYDIPVLSPAVDAAVA